MGHGKSEGERVMVQTFDVYVDDVFYHIDEVRKSHPELPVYLFGHSMVIVNNLYWTYIVW